MFFNLSFGKEHREETHCDKNEKQPAASLFSLLFHDLSAEKRKKKTVIYKFQCLDKTRRKVHTEIICQYKTNIT